MEKQIKRIASVTVLAWLSLVPLVYAGDVKIFPGVSCRAQNPQSSIALYANAIHNNGAGVARVFCPIVRDNHTNLNGVIAGAVKFQSFDDAAIECTLYSYDQYGNEKDSETISKISNAPVFIVFQNVGTSEGNGFYTFSCELPPGAVIYSYTIHEY